MHHSSDLCLQVARAPKLVEIIAAVPEEFRQVLLPQLKAKPVRTASGIAVVAVMSKPHRCPHIATTGNICVYCPGGPDSDFEYSTQSYTGYEPTSMRAIRARCCNPENHLNCRGPTSNQHTRLQSLVAPEPLKCLSQLSDAGGSVAWMPTNAESSDKRTQAPSFVGPVRWVCLFLQASVLQLFHLGVLAYYLVALIPNKVVIAGVKSRHVQQCFKPVSHCVSPMQVPPICSSSGPCGSAAPPRPQR